MTNNWEKFSNAYLQSDEETKFFLDSNIIPLFIQSNFSEHNVDQEVIRNLIIYASNSILGITESIELQEYLTEKNINTTEYTNVLSLSQELFIKKDDYLKLSSVNIEKHTRDQILTGRGLASIYLYSSVDAQISLARYFLSHEITPVNLFKKLSVLIRDIILGFYKTEDTVPLLQQELGLDAKTAALLGADVLDFLAPLSDPSWQPPADNSDMEESIEIESAAPNVNYVTPIEPTQVETRVPEIRTMAGDMLEERSPVRSTYNPVAALDEPLYQSSQPVIEKKVPDAPSYNAPLYQAPKPNVDAPLEKPRWG